MTSRRPMREHDDRPSALSLRASTSFVAGVAATGMMFPPTQYAATGRSPSKTP